ncbi:MAG: hypothetical protein ABJB97_02130 [Acidobacteriota bacterium]
MRKRLLGLVVGFVLASAVLASGSLAQQRRPRPAAAAAPAPDLKIKYRTTTSGQSSEVVTMLKGMRERSESHSGYGDSVNITQCDLKRTMQVSDSTRKYLITPMSTGDSAAASADNSSTTGPAEPVRTGGVLTYITTVTDTGERKEMFGFTARHIKSSLTMQSSPDACNPVNQRVETDGWYIDLAFGLDCNLGRTQAMANRYTPPGGCRDRVSFKQVGATKTGYPLSETMMMSGPDGRVMFTTSKEVVELERGPLDAALFDAPPGYAETTNSQELYPTPTTAAVTGMPSYDRQIQENNPNTETAAMQMKPAGTLRVGVVSLNNKSDRPLSLESVRSRLVGGIDGGGIDAVPLNAATQSEAEAEAKIKQCDFILFTDLSTLKTSAAKKIGGFLGRAAGVSGVDRTESRVDFRLFAVGESSPLLQSSATAKEEGDEVSVGASVDTEARMVSAEVRKRSRN